MAAERLSMRKIREMLRLQAAGHSRRAIARSLAISHSTVRDYQHRAQTAGVSWPLPPEWTDSDLESRLFPQLTPSSTPRPLPEWAQVHREMKARKKTKVTLQLLWLEYKEIHPDGLQYSQYCQLYRTWRGNLDRVLRQEHRAGEKVFVDYAGQTVPVIDRTTGEILEAQIFVGVLGASNFTFAEACWSQELPEWIGAHVHMYEHFGGVPELTVPDNLKSGVRHACYYDPDVNPTYHEMAVHYGTAILPTRPVKPKDKAKAESGVQLVERWILARLRKHTFFSLADLNGEIHRLLELLNDRPFQKLEGCRRSLYEELDRPALQPLPVQPYEFARWKKVRPNIDYHIEIEGHYYSVPHQLSREAMEARYTRTAVEVIHRGKRVAAHVRSRRPGGFTTEPSHRPKAHQKYLEWTPSRLVAWANKTGPRTGELVGRILESKPHPEQGYRACLGLLRLADTYTPQRLEAACDRALHIGGISYRSVKSILKNGLDQIPLEEQTQLALPQDHDHVRGDRYYATTDHGGDQ
ncbi:MAG: IS21 family transposase [Gammaproteobacteria bacterium]|jgi:transposase|nr:IS21 family transposase [Gemmatimonadota bacterium]MBT6478625.1 IS21 family transposase [Gammaproteobacteria bacterium]MBT7830883.1 IS21 family transposase [Candidatus Neomarinimicrobiota bacterium]